MRGGRRKLPWIGIMVALLLLGGSAGALFLSPWLKIARVSVAGAEKLGATAVVEAAELVGKNILFVDVGAVERSLKGRLPMIGEVTLSRIFPDAVSLTVKERQPWANWQVGNKKWVIDEEGLVVAPSPRPELPTIRDMDNVAVQAGGQVDATPLPLVKRLLEALPQEAGLKAASFEYLRNGGLVVITDKGLRARFGGDEDFDYKLAVWKGLLAKRAAGEVAFQHVDLRFGYRPFLR